MNKLQCPCTFVFCFYHNTEKMLLRSKLNHNQLAIKSLYKKYFFRTVICHSSRENRDENLAKQYSSRT